MPLEKNYPIRVFNLWQMKIFHHLSNLKIKKKPELLKFYIEEDEKIYNQISEYGQKLITDNNVNNKIKYYKKIIKLYEIASAQFLIIFSLGLKLMEKQNKIKNSEELIKIHDEWRNTVAFKEEMMIEHLLSFFKSLFKAKKLNIKPLAIINYLTANEVEKWLHQTITDEQMLKIIEKRKRNGYIYLGLRKYKEEVIDELTEVNKIRQYFINLNKEKEQTAITGQIIYKEANKIKGEVIVIKDKNELKYKKDLIKGKILIAIQTSPHYIPYLKQTKAIITDEGGITCHAAIIARELKITCMVGAKTATKTFKDGDIIIIDTENETVIKENKND